MKLTWTAAAWMVALLCDGLLAQEWPPETFDASVGVNVWATPPGARELSSIGRTGVGWVRTADARAATQGADGALDFTKYDALLDGLAERGLRAMVILGNGEGEIVGPPPSTREERSAFIEWALAMVDRYAGRGVLWEIWNEPNEEAYWGGRPAVDEYVELALEVCDAIKKAHPAEVLIGPGLAPNWKTTPPTIDTQFLEACFAAGLLEYWDSVSIHPYLFTFAAPEAMGAEYARLRAIIDLYAPAGKEVGIISSELGVPSDAWPGLDEATAARLLPRQWLSHQAYGIRLSIWYCWEDLPTDPGDPDAWAAHCGLVRTRRTCSEDPDPVPKPAYHAALTVASILSGHRFVRRLPVGGPDDWVLEFEGEDGVRLAAWTTASEGHDVVLPGLPGRFRVTGHLGEDLGTIDADCSGVTVTLSEDVRYLAPERVEVPASRLERLTRGISVWPFQDAKSVGLSDEDYALLRSLGFRHVRLSFSPDFIFENDPEDPRNPDRVDADHLRKLEEEIKKIHTHGLAVIVTFMDPTNEQFEPFLRKQEFLDRFCRFWTLLAAWLRSQDPETTFLEPMQEPVFPNDEWWRMQERLIAAVREGAPDHTIIGSGGGGSFIEALEDMSAPSDGNTVYSIHDYTPMTFTFQGAPETWSQPWTRYVHELPYPSTPENVQGAIDRIRCDSEAAREAIEEIRGYGCEEWNLARIDALFCTVRRWMYAHPRTPVMMGEFGVLSDFAIAEARRDFLGDVRRTAERYGIPWGLWDYTPGAGGFGILREVCGRAEVDWDLIRALGLLDAPVPSPQAATPR